MTIEASIARFGATHFGPTTPRSRERRPWGLARRAAVTAIVTVTIGAFAVAVTSAVDSSDSVDRGHVSQDR